MIKGIKITIPEPCKQDWNSLTVVEQGRFCGSCEKIVIDFQKMSDKELIDYYFSHRSALSREWLTMEEIEIDIIPTPPDRSILIGGW